MKIIKEIENKIKKKENIKKEIKKKIDIVNNIVFFVWSSIYLYFFFKSNFLKNLSIINLLPYISAMLLISSIINSFVLIKYDKQYAKKYREEFIEMFFIGLFGLLATFLLYKSLCK